MYICWKFRRKVAQIFIEGGERAVMTYFSQRGMIYPAQASYCVRHPSAAYAVQSQIESDNTLQSEFDYADSYGLEVESDAYMWLRSNGANMRLRDRR